MLRKNRGSFENVLKNIASYDQSLPDIEQLNFQKLMNSANSPKSSHSANSSIIEWSEHLDHNEQLKHRLDTTTNTVVKVPTVLKQTYKKGKLSPNSQLLTND